MSSIFTKFGATSFMSPNTTAKNVAMGILGSVVGGIVGGFVLKATKGITIGNLTNPRGMHTAHTLGMIVNSDDNSNLIFQFNPSELSIEHGANYATIESPGSDYPVVYYCGRRIESIPLTLQFYGVNNNVKVEQFFETITTPRKKQKNIIRGTNQFISPPVLSFVWGQRVYDVLMETASIKKNMFNAQLQTMDMTVTCKMVVLKAHPVKWSTWGSFPSIGGIPMMF